MRVQLEYGRDGLRVEVPDRNFHRLGLQPIGTGRPGSAEAADGLAGAHEPAHDVASQESAGTRHEDHAVAPGRQGNPPLRLPLLCGREKTVPSEAAAGRSVAIGAGWPVHANTLGGIQGATSAGEGTNRAISPGAARGAMPLALARGLGEEGRKDCLDAFGPALGALDSFAVTLADGHGQRESLSTPAAAKIVSRHGHPPEECRRVDGPRQAIVVGGEGSMMPLAASEAAASSV